MKPHVPSRPSATVVPRSLRSTSDYRCLPPDDPACSDRMPHQDTVLLIYVFSIFGLVLMLMIGSFYACHLYTERCERRRLRVAPQAIQVLDSQVVPVKQAFFIEQPDGHSDVAWAISTAVHAQPSTDVPQTAKVVAALTHPRNPSLGIQQPSTAESPSQALLSDGQLDTTVAFTVTGQSAAEPYRQLLPHHS